MHGIVLFDGECNFCDGSVQFIIKRDAAGYFKFASLQSPVGQALLKQYNIPTNLDSFILIEDGRVYSKSTAGLKVCRHLDGPWKLCYAARVIPAPIRNLVYNLIAKNRYKWFGKMEVCMLPTPEQRKRFL